MAASPLFGETSPEGLPVVLQSGNRIAAKVEGEIITVEELRKEMAPLLRRVQSQSESEEAFHENIRNLTREILRDRVDRILIVRDFRSKEFEIPESFVEGEFNKVIREDFNGDRSRFLTYLKSQDQTVRDFRKQLEERIIVDVMFQRMRRSQAEISPEKIEQYYRKNLSRFQSDSRIRLRQIVLLLRPNETEDELRARANNVMAQLNLGRSFGEVAREQSEDAMARRGGDYGWVEQKDIQPDLAAIAFNLQPRIPSQPVLLKDAAIILYVEEKREAGPLPLTEVRDEIEKVIIDDLARETRQRWIERLRKDAFVEYYI